MKRPVRLSYLQRLFYRNPQGYRSSELARLCGVDQRTINRDLLDLQGEPFYLPLVQDDDWRWRLMEGHRFTLPPIHLSLQEAAALYLAARLLDRASDEPNPYIGRALLALADALPEEVGRQVRTLASGRLGDEQSRFARVFEVITLGWATGRKVRIRHRSLRSDRAYDYVLSPYLIELWGPGSAAYVIGHASYFDALRTFKLERIEEAELLQETFELPPGFDPAGLLGRAWGIMYGEEEREVVLRFTPAVARRVCETVWHPSQEIEQQPDGGCILRVRVAHTLEMKPWIRSWGPECEVLAPAELRAEIADELRRAAQVYEGGGAA
ncbi:MAG: WYL domain-containing protein [Anaerolineae bacterium]|nr:WYL domain-containing protein [Anaerolineae bacterium]